MQRRWDWLLVHVHHEIWFVDEETEVCGVFEDVWDEIRRLDSLSLLVPQLTDELVFEPLLSAVKSP